jgi:hypothetical protein
MIVHPALAAGRFARAIRPLLQNPDAYRVSGIELIHFDFPYLYVDLEVRDRNQWLRLRVDGTDFNYRPVDGRWVNQENVILREGAGVVPSGNGFQSAPMDGCDGPWLCFLGWKAWHNHGGHQDTPWPAIRTDASFSPLALVHQLQADLNRQGLSFK